MATTARRSYIVPGRCIMPDRWYVNDSLESVEWQSGYRFMVSQSYSTISGGSVHTTVSEWDADTGMFIERTSMPDTPTRSQGTRAAIAFIKSHA